MLQIDPKKGTAQTVGNRSVLELAPGLRIWPWHGTVEAADGCIYGIPYAATSVLKFDPRTQKLSTFGQLQAGDKKYSCGVLGP